MKHELIKLSYSYDAFEPMMSKETLEYHHDKHHTGYISKLNNLIVDTEFKSSILSPKLSTPSPALDSIITVQFGSIEAFWKLLNWRFISFNYVNHEEHREDYFSNFYKDNIPYCDYTDSLEAMEEAGS